MFFLHHYRHNFGWHHHKYLGGLRQAQGAFDMLRVHSTSSGIRKTREQSIKKAPALRQAQGPGASIKFCA